jgi:hypothetical protein
MDIHVSVGEWINSLMVRMASADDGDCFYLPTMMHLHAYLLVKEQSFADKNFKVEVQESA